MNIRRLQRQFIGYSALFLNSAGAILKLVFAKVFSIENTGIRSKVILKSTGVSNNCRSQFVTAIKLADILSRSPGNLKAFC